MTFSTNFANVVTFKSDWDSRRERGGWFKVTTGRVSAYALASRWNKQGQYVGNVRNYSLYRNRKAN